MIRGSDFFLMAMVLIVALAAYHALFPLDALTIFTRFLGLGGFMLLCLLLMLGPLAVLFPKNFAALLEYRRSVALASFAFVFLHFFLVFSGYYSWDLGKTLSGWLLILGAPALVLYIILALISNSWSMRNVPQWKNIQRLAYIIFILSFAHFVLKANGLFLNLGGGKTFVNISEIAMIALGIITIVLQVAGAILVLSRKSSSGPS